MISILIYLLAFFAGCIVCDLLRSGQERYRLRQATRAAASLCDPLEAAYEEWSVNPAYWCNRPGCSRCWGWWGLS
ncbi:hypothetical protein AB0K16_19415 [Nonomuraea jabiensis]|uniref:hypothetical protein n=1 Tax=Nonomuraea jabiensis TaxID=882448 RepID=UPI00342841E1